MNPGEIGRSLWRVTIDKNFRTTEDEEMIEKVGYKTTTA
jgi:hypothetical protein